MENGNGRRIVYGPVLFMTRQYGKLMQLSYDTIHFRQREILISRQKFLL